MIFSADDNDPVIFRYTRAQALEDGVLVDLTAWSRDAGFVVPVACTRTVWDRWIVPPEETRELGQSERGRAHDVLWVLFVMIKKSKSAGARIDFEVMFLQTPQRHRRVRLKAICGPGDNAEPVITIMTPEED